jgi:signal transduction histidine kinase/response regulator RpfG family c-di-GMP phosphodiesterase
VTSRTIGVLAPTGRDSQVISQILRRQGIECVICDDVAGLIDRLNTSAVGSAIIAEEAMRDGEQERLQDWLQRQPPWSDLPIILLTRRLQNSAFQAGLASALGNVTLLERPFHAVTLVSAAEAAIRARVRQREAERYIGELAARERELKLERARLARSEAQLREANEKLGQRFAEALKEKQVLADVVEGTDAFVQVADHDFRWLAVNGAARAEFERIYGVRPQIGASMLDALRNMPEHREAVWAVWSRALAGEQFTEVGQFGDPARDRRHYEMKFSPLKDAQGRLIGAYQFVYDVTERVREQQLLAEAQARVHEMAKMETLGQLTGGVAHDFNNLLTPIVGALDLLHRKFEHDARTRRLITGALDASERAAVLVQRLLSFARRQHLQARPVNVGELVIGIQDLVQRSIGPQVHVKVAVEPELAAATIDPNQLELAVLNLAVNASDAMSGGGELVIDVAQRQVMADEVEGLNAGDYIRLAVIDSGTGMDDGTLHRAIEPFFTTKGPGEGTGLGLSMVHGLAAQSGGTLRILSRPGEGTTAEIWLPVAEGEADPLQVTTPDVPPQPRQAVVLVVDDEEIVRRATADMLRGLGHEVFEAASGSKALGMLQDNADIELIVSDFLMPVMRGDELIRQAKTLRPALKALLVTGYARMSGKDNAIARLAKPFRAADLAREVGKLLSENVVELDSRRTS